jgi:DNA-binding response OmpR family regulator
LAEDCAQSRIQDINGHTDPIEDAMLESAALKVLIIDDEETAGSMIQRRLQRRGLNAVFHQGFFGATMAAVGFRPDAILLDVNMHGLSGSSLVPTLRKREELAKTRIYLFSSMDPQPLARLATESGADGWLSKSAQMAEIIEALMPAKEAEG